MAQLDIEFVESMFEEQTHRKMWSMEKKHVASLIAAVYIVAGHDSFVKFWQRRVGAEEMAGPPDEFSMAGCLDSKIE